MNETPKDTILVEHVWSTLRSQAEALLGPRPEIDAAIQNAVLARATFADALANLLFDLMRYTVPQGVELDRLFVKVITENPEIGRNAAADLEKLAAVNPACPNILCGFMSFRGFLGLQLYRITHVLWNSGQQQLAAMLQNWGALKFNMDIHPAAQIGKAVFLDHGMGIVVGSTAVIEDGVNMWHGVTLGSTLTQSGDRHPKIRRNATVCANATILGNIEVGEGAIVAAGSVVLKSVEAGMVAAGVPAKIVARAPEKLNAIDKEIRSIHAQES